MATTKPRRRDPYSSTRVLLPERDLAEVVLEVATPLLARLGPAPSLEDSRDAIELTVTFWNANVLASKLWEYPRLKELRELKKRMSGKEASAEDAATFARLTECWRKHWLDPRLVESWTYEPGADGAPRLACEMGLPDGVEPMVPSPAEKRIAIGGAFLDEVRISLSGNMYLGFPVEQHRGVIAEDGTATVDAMMPAVLQLFATGRLPPVRGGTVDVVIGRRKLGPMVLTKVQCGGRSSHLHDVAILTFEPPTT